jgi:hypothetical protein
MFIFRDRGSIKQIYHIHIFDLIKLISVIKFGAFFNINMVKVKKFDKVKTKTSYISKPNGYI